MRTPWPARLALITATSLVLGACGDDAEDAAPPTGEEPGQPATQTSAEAEGAVEVVMIGADGSDVGTVTLTTEGETTRVEAEIDSLEPGFHGFHIHDVGVCDPDAPDGPFTSATGHYVGDGGIHGEHDGDMPSLYVTDDGSASLSVILDAFTVDELIAGDGSAVMIHAGPDNFANIPDRYTSSEADAAGPDDMTTSTGDAGGRVACGVVEA